MHVHLPWSTWLHAATPMELAGHLVSHVGTLVCVDPSRETWFQRFCVLIENKHFKSKLKKVHPCSSEYIRSALTHGNKRQRLETELSTSQGEAKLFVFITKTHRKEMQNTKQPKAKGEKNDIQSEDFPRVNVCFYPSALRSA